MKWLGFIIGAVIILVGGWFLLTAQRTDVKAGSSENSISSTLSVGLQQPGITVVVDEAVFKKNGYVVIHKEEGGAPGTVIGHSNMLLAGVQRDVRVTLTEEIKGGESVFVMLHDDDGDRSYSFPGPDVPTTNEKGDVAVIRAEVSAQAE